MLEREEYVEQAHFFGLLAERLAEGVPLQELLQQAKQETLASTKLPLAIDFLLGELVHTGAMGPGMSKLSHYFTPFQAYVMSAAEEERGRFDIRVAIPILEGEAKYLASEQHCSAGLFLFEFEVLCRKRLSYDAGLRAIASGPIFDEQWREWIITLSRQVGLVDFASLLYVRGEHPSGARAGADGEKPPLFSEKAAKIARANIGKDPIYLFAALQRHLGYPAVPRPRPVDPAKNLWPQLLRRLDKLETRIKLLEDEQRSDSIDLRSFIQPPPSPNSS